MNLRSSIRSNPLLRGALIAPSVVVLVFAFFNLTSAVDPSAAMRQVTVAVVNQDEGLPGPNGTAMRLADQINNVLPLPEMATGLRTILIGGPEGSVPWVSTSVTAVAAMTLIVAGTVVAAKIKAR